MKIFVNARFLSQPISGVQRYAIECSRKIKKIWPETRFLCPKNIWNHDVFLELEAEIVGSKTGHMWEQVDLPRFARANGNAPLFNPCNTAPLLYNHNFTTVHDLAFYHHPEWNSRLFSIWYNFLIPRVARRSRHIFTVSQTVAGELNEHYRLAPENLSVTYNGISDVISGKAISLPRNKKPVILSVGTFNIRKNQGALIEAFLKSKVRHSHTLILVGEKNRVFRDSGIGDQISAGDNVQFVSNAGEEDLSRLYGEAEIIASTSLYEGFGIPLLEGLANGCKLLCSEIPVYRELYNEVATFCDPTDIDSIASALETCLAANAPQQEVVDKLLTTYSYDHAAHVITSTISRIS